MKLIIAIHTKSGQTATCARAIADKFQKTGNEVDIVMLHTTGEVSPRSKDFEIKNPPDPGKYDAIVLGGPVWEFNASPVIMKYLFTLKNLSGKKALNFVTKGLPFNWTGGNQALGAMNKRVAALSGIVLQGEIIKKATIANKEHLDRFAERVFKAFTN